MATEYKWLGASGSVRLGESGSVPISVPTEALPDGQLMGFLRSTPIPANCLAISSIKLFYRRTGTGNLYLKFACSHIAKADGTLTEDADSYTARDGSTVSTTALGSITLPTSAYNALTSMLEGDTLNVSVYRDATNVLDTYTTDLDIAGFLIAYTVTDTSTAASSTTTTQHTTYDDLIGDILAGLNEEDRLEGLSPETIQLWILEAEKQICDRIEIQDKYTLGLNTDVIKYNFQNRPVVSGATAATPIVIASTAHGLAVADRILLQDVVGVTGANGSRYVSAVADANHFTIKQISDVTDATNETPVSITTAEPHGKSTGDTVTVSGVLGNTAANVTDNAITVVDANTFTLDDVVGNGAYTSGGIVTSDTVGAGTWTSGGRYWKDDEIPTFFKRFKVGDRLWGTVHKEVVAVDNNILRNKERRETEKYALYSDSCSPSYMTEWMSERVRYLEFYPAPQSDHNITLWGRIKITPRDYATDPLTTNIHLSSDYESAIVAFVENKIYRWLKEYKLAKESYARYEDEIKEMRISFPRNIVQRIAYW